MIPLDDRVLVEPIKEPETTKGGILIPDSGRKKNKGTVVAIGTKVKKLRNGDTILFFEGDGIEINYRGADLLILREGKEDRPGNIISVL
jgi:chaperonin GroES